MAEPPRCKVPALLASGRLPEGEAGTGWKMGRLTLLAAPSLGKAPPLPMTAVLCAVAETRCLRPLASAPGSSPVDTVTVAPSGSSGIRFSPLSFEIMVWEMATPACLTFPTPFPTTWLILPMTWASLHGFGTLSQQ